MEVTEEEIFSEEGKSCWQTFSCNDGDKFVLGDWYEEETNLFASCQNLGFSGEEEVVEMEAAEILAEQRHLCSICGKEFRREGNVRVHMRSHGEQYKSKETLMSSRPKSCRSSRSYYSCPFQGCRYNKQHTNFKHLKSIISLRNHYRRSHCAKMYICNNCGKEFSFVGDLKIHGNKCGHETWRCWCSLLFSTRNKLLRHVRLGHKPVPALVASNGEIDKAPQHSAQELHSFAVQDSPILSEGSPSYGLGLKAIAESEYDYERMESGVSLSSGDGPCSVLYASLCHLLLP